MKLIQNLKETVRQESGKALVFFLSSMTVVMFALGVGGDLEPVEKINWLAALSIFLVTAVLFVATFKIAFKEQFLVAIFEGVASAVGFVAGELLSCVLPYWSVLPLSLAGFAILGVYLIAKKKGVTWAQARVVLVSFLFMGVCFGLVGFFTAWVIHHIDAGWTAISFVGPIEAVIAYRFGRYLKQQNVSREIALGIGWGTGVGFNLVLPIAYLFVFSP